MFHTSADTSTVKCTAPNVHCTTNISNASVTHKWIILRCKSTVRIPCVAIWHALCLSWHRCFVFRLSASYEAFSILAHLIGSWICFPSPFFGLASSMQLISLSSWPSEHQPTAIQPSSMIAFSLYGALVFAALS